MKVTPVLAESHTAFKEFIEDKNLNISHFAFVANQDTIKGQRGLVLSVGRWWRNPNYDSEFHKQLESYAHRGLISVVKGILSDRVILD